MKKSADQILNEIINTPVDEYSTPCSITADVADALDSLIEKMESGGVRHVPIFDKKKLVGIISDRDISNVAPGSKITAKEAMSSDVYQVNCGTLLRDVVFEMSTKKIGSTLVYDQESDEYLIFTSIDALNALNEILRA